MSYSISAGSIVNVVALTSQPHLYETPWDGPWVTNCSPAEVQDCYANWESEVKELLKVSGDLVPSATLA